MSRILHLMATVLLLCGVAAAQANAPARSPGSRPAREFKPPVPRVAPAPVLVPPPEMPWLAPGFENAGSSVSDQAQSLLGRTPTATPPPTVPSVIRAILGFVALMVLAYLGGARRVQTLEHQWNIAHAMTTGLPFVLLGLIAAMPQIGVLTPAVLDDVAPLLPLGLGWIGFVVGSRFDVRKLDRMPEGTGTVVLLMAAVPVLLMTVPLAFTISKMRGQPADLQLVREALLLATAGTIAARSAPGFLRALLPHQQISDRLMRTVELEQLTGVFGLMMISAFYRPPGTLVAWQLPGTAWLFMTLGVGTAMGVLLYAALTRILKDPQFTVVLIGCVAFTAGMASYLRISPLTACFITGAIAVNLGPKWQPQIREVFERTERPIYFLFMVIAGALWHPWEWQGWVLMVVFVSVRFVSKWLTSTALRQAPSIGLTVDEKRALTAAPMGALSVAIVVSAQDLYPGPAVPWIVTSVIGGGLVTEVVLQIIRRHYGQRADGDSGYATQEPLPEVD